MVVVLLIRQAYHRSNVCQCTVPLHSKICLASHSVLVRITCRGGGSSHEAGISQKQCLLTHSTITFQLLIHQSVSSSAAAASLYMCFIVCTVQIYHFISKNRNFHGKTHTPTALYALLNFWGFCIIKCPS